MGKRNPCSARARIQLTDDMNVIIFFNCGSLVRGLSLCNMMDGFMVLLWLLFTTQVDKMLLKRIFKKWWPWKQPNQRKRNGYRWKLVSVSGFELLPGLESCGLSGRNHPHAQTYEYKQARIQMHSTQESFYKCVQACFRMSTGNLCQGANIFGNCYPPPPKKGHNLCSFL